MARGKKAVRAAQKRAGELRTHVSTSTEQQGHDEVQREKSEQPKRPRKARELRKQLFRKERVRAQNRLTKACVAHAYTSDGDVSAVDGSPVAAVDTGRSTCAHEAYVNVSVEDDEGWQQQRPSRRRVYDACSWADACLENVCEPRESGESCTSDTDIDAADFLCD